MKLPLCLLLSLTATVGFCADPTKDLVTRTETLDRDMLQANANFGYTDEEIRKYFSAPQVFEYDYTGFARQLVKALPAPGIHPRVLFAPDDLPGLRKQLADTKPGKLAMDGIRVALQELITGPKAKYASVYQDAANGVPNLDITSVETACAIIYENFRCLLDEDAAGAKKAAAALATLALLDARALDEAYAKSDQKSGKPRLRDYQSYKGITHSGLLGLGYDFAYNAMTDAQRTNVRATLAKASNGFTAIGCEALPAVPANTSNWIPMHMPMLFLVTAIEGEPGYNAATYRRFVSGYKRYLSVGFFPSGEMFESMGKNFLCAQNLLLIGNRGDDLIALKQVRAQVSNYYLNAMDAWGGKFTFFDSLGGRGNTTPMQDVMIVKRMFPADPAVDFVYRNVVGDDYTFFKPKAHFGHPLHLGDPLMCAVYSVSYDETKSFDQARADAVRGRSLTYYSDDSGNMITRSVWTPDATVLHLLTRCVAGGHVYADRSNFNLQALGRHWAIYKPMRQVEEHYAPRNRSVILIDGEGPGFAMGRSVALEDGPLATFAAADSKPAFDWTTGGNNRYPRGGLPVPFSGNDFRLNKSAKPWMNLPWSDLPNWQSSKKGAELWLPHFPVQRAFRTAGLMRGKHPYALIADDYQKDTAPHIYDWGMILEDDVTLVSKSGDDAVLGEGKTGPRARFLLVRVLNAEGRDPATPAVVDYDLPNPPMKPISLKRLGITAKAVAPDFKVLLFPYIDGAEQPRTAWNPTRTRLTVTWSDQEDVIDFLKNDDGRTRVHATRNGVNLASVR